MSDSAISKTIRSTIIKAIALTLALSFFYVAWISNIKTVQVANLKIFDIFYSLANLFGKTNNSIDDIVLVAIDDESVRTMDMRWPWPRSFMAKVIDKIRKQGTSVIAVDLIFTGKSDDEEQDRIFVEVLKETSNLVAAAYFGNDGKYIIPEENVAKNVKAFGFVNKPRDFDNVVRRMRPLATTSSGKVIDYSLSVKTAAEILDISPRDIVKDVPLLDNGTAYIRFFGKKNRFNTIPIWKILKGQADLTDLKDKAVFLGVSAEVFHDTYQTPVGLTPGVLIAANETLTYTTRSFFTYATRLTELIILFCFILVAITAAMRISVIHGIFLNALEIAVFCILGIFLLTRSVIIDYFGVILLTIIPSVLLYSGRYVGLAIENMMLKKESITDGLTRLYGYRYFDLRLKLQLKKTLSGGKMFALEMYDIDHFKNINDTYGHEFGNVILKAVAKVLSESCRKSDTVARFGGEEFCILMPGAKAENAFKHADRIRGSIGEMKFKTEKDETVKVTISGGIVTTDEYVSEDHLDMLRAADTALYKSKHSGRDKITMFNKEDKILEE